MSLLKNHFSCQASAVVHLRAALDAAGLAAVNVSASDESYYDDALATWQSFNSTTRAVVAQVNTHGWAGPVGCGESAGSGKALF